MRKYVKNVWAVCSLNLNEWSDYIKKLSLLSVLCSWELNKFRSENFSLQGPLKDGGGAMPNLEGGWGLPLAQLFEIYWNSRAIKFIKISKIHIAIHPSDEKRKIFLFHSLLYTFRWKKKTDSQKIVINFSVFVFSYNTKTTTMTTCGKLDYYPNSISFHSCCLVLGGWMGGNGKWAEETKACNL